jgi:carboxymethylenebutenolidase
MILEVTLSGARGDMPVYVGVPRGEGPWPGVMVVSDALGMTTDLRNQVDWLASEGYLAAAPDLYYWGGRLRCLFSTVRQAGSGEGQIFDDFETVRSWLIDHPDGTGKVGVIGFCLGGGFALALAGNGRFDVASSNYGGLTKNALAGLAGSCPIVGSYGARDRSLRKEPEQISSVLSEHGIPFDMKVYPDAGHSFMNDHLRSETPMWLIISGKLVASGYHEPSANDARSRIVAFFGEHLS